MSYMNFSLFMRTGEYNIYARLQEWGYTHKSVNHGRGEYAQDEDGDGRGFGRCCGLEKGGRKTPEHIKSRSSNVLGQSVCPAQLLGQAHPLQVIVSHGGGASCCAQATALGLICQQIGHSLRQGLVVKKRHKQSVFTVTDDFVQRCRVAGHHGTPDAHGLYQTPRQHKRIGEVHMNR